jgi:ferredoxin
MRVVVDPWVCQSHLQCVSTAPDVFTYDDEHSYAVAVAGDVPPELEQAARQAVLLCPEQAISIEE